MKNNRLRGVILGTVRRAKGLTTGLALAILGSIVLALLPPLVLERAVDTLTGGRTVGLGLALLYFLLLAASGLIDAAKEVLITVFGQKITHGIRSEMCRKLSRLPAAYFTAHTPGDTVSRFVGDVDTVEDLFASGVISMVVDACTVISILIVIFVKSRGLGILLLLVTPLLFLMTRAFQKRMLKAQIENRVAVGRVSQHVPETIRCIRMIHNLGREAYMERRYDGYIQDSYRAMEKSNFFDSIYSPIILVVSAAVVAVMMIGSAAGGEWQSFFGMSVGTAVAIIAYVGKVFGPLESIGMEIQNIQSAVAGVRRIRDFLTEPEKPETDPSITASSLQKSGSACVELQNVTFGYTPEETILRDCCFSAQKGEHITLTGRTGAGKSTIFKLLLGLYSPNRGSVKIFGALADRIPDGEKRGLFGYVEQSFRSVPGTVAEQITLFDPSLSREDVETAAKTVGIHDAILALDGGYDAEYRDALFSQGQRQLLAVARAIAADPPILLLDEITANLDAGTEAAILGALQKASAHRTVISISHRLYEVDGGREIHLGEYALTE